MIATTTTTQNHLADKDAVGSITWWLDVLTRNGTGYVLRTDNDGAWADDFQYASSPLYGGTLYGDKQSAVVAHLRGVPDTRRSRGRRMASVNFDIAVAAGSTDPLAVKLILDRIARNFEGSRASYGYYTANASTPEKVEMDAGRLHVRTWGDLWFRAEIINSAQFFKAKIPLYNLSIKRWNRIDDTLDNPDPNSYWDQIDDLAGVSGKGRFRRGARAADGPGNYRADDFEGYQPYGGRNWRTGG